MISKHLSPISQLADVPNAFFKKIHIKYEMQDKPKPIPPPGRPSHTRCPVFGGPLIYKDVCVQPGMFPRQPVDRRMIGADSVAAFIRICRDVPLLHLLVETNYQTKFPSAPGNQGEISLSTKIAQYGY